MPTLYPPDSIAWGKRGESPGLKHAQQTAWAAAFCTQPEEFDCEITDIEGTLPLELGGSTLFRNGPARFERGDQRVAHYLDGDGYLSKFTFLPGGRVYYASRFVRTAEYQQECAANAFRFRTTFGNLPHGNAFNLYLKNPANTHIVPWGHKLLALYEAGLPYRIDPHTLATLGREDFSGQLNPAPLPANRWQALCQRSQGQQAITAHPHIDPLRQRLVSWSWGVTPWALQLDICEYDAHWQRLSRRSYAMPGAAVNPHDFALTPNYTIFFENALAFDLWPFLLGRKSPAYCLRLLAKPTKVHLVPRPDGDKAAEKPLVLETCPWFSIHQACASERSDGTVEVYSSGWPQASGNFLTSWGGYAPNFDAIAPTFLWQTLIDPARRKLTHRLAPGAENCCIAHPHIHPQYETQPSRYLYMAYCNDIGQSSPPTGYLKLDTHTHQHQIWSSHPLSFTEEPIFVPTNSSSSGLETAEDNGWLLGMIYDHLKQRSCLAIFDAAQLSAGPVCRLWLNHRVPHGLHGAWCDGRTFTD